MVLEPLLWVDFQVMIDALGHFYYIDLDRVTQPNHPFVLRKVRRKQQKQCLEHLRGIKDSIVLGMPFPDLLPMEDYSNFYWADLGEWAQEAAMLLGFVPEQESAIRSGRADLCESVAVISSQLIAKEQPGVSCSSEGTLPLISCKRRRSVASATLLSRGIEPIRPRV